jgi:TonB family protein
MKRWMNIFLGILWLWCGGFALSPAPRLDLKLRVYEGARQGAVAAPGFVTASYLHPTITANLDMEAGFDVESEKAQIKRVFGLQDVALLTEADLTIGEERAGQAEDTVRHAFRLDGSSFMAIMILKEWSGSAKFLVLFNETSGEKPKNVLTTEMLLVGGHSAVFGFEDKSGRPYFCSFHISGPPDKVPPRMPSPPPPPPPPPLAPDLKAKIAEFEKGAVKAWNAVNPPRLIKKVDPVYPPEARTAGLQGVVVLNVRTDAEGYVKEVMVLKSSVVGRPQGSEIFHEPAINAVKQWKYEPYLQDGQPKELVFSVLVRFEPK